MPLSEKQKRIYASAPVNEVFRQGLSLSHPLFTRRFFLTNHPVAFDGFIDGALRRFQVVPFTALEPKRDDGGQQDLRIQIDNTDPSFMAELENAARDFDDGISCEYYIFAGSERVPQNNPPLRLKLTAIEATVQAIVGTASRSDIVNAEFPRRYYRINEFPGMAR